jgi:hypothetical protein
MSWSGRFKVSNRLLTRAARAAALELTSTQTGWRTPPRKSGGHWKRCLLRSQSSFSARALDSDRVRQARSQRPPPVVASETRRRNRRQLVGPERGCTRGGFAFLFVTAMKGSSLADLGSRQQHRPGAPGPQKENAAGRRLPGDEAQKVLREAVRTSGAGAQ